MDKPKLKKYPIPWRASNSVKMGIKKGDDNDVLFTHYIKMKGEPIMSYSQEYINKYGEEEVIAIYESRWNEGDE